MAIALSVSPDIDLHDIRALPVLFLYARTTFKTLSHVLELWLAYFPLGYGLGMAIDRPGRRWVLLIGLTLIVAAPLEYMQGWVEGRYPDVTDIVWRSPAPGWVPR